MASTPAPAAHRLALLIGLSWVAIHNCASPVRAQASLPDPGQFTCPKSECRMNQSSGSSSSVGVGVTSTFGVNSSAQSTSNYNASASASLVLNAFDATTPPISNVNSSLQTIGNSESNSPLTLTINSETIQSKSKDGDDASFFNASKYTSDETNGSNAEFNAAGFTASQDLRFKGSPQAVKEESTTSTSTADSGSTFKADVIKILNKTGGPEVGNGNSSAGSETRTRFQADITTSAFVNAFMSSF
jgi:hypothetical protein